MKQYHFYGAKGGVGATTLACAFAVMKATEGTSTAYGSLQDLHNSWDWSVDDDAFPVLGLPAPGTYANSIEMRVRDNLVINSFVTNWEDTGEMNLPDVAVSSHHFFPLSLSRYVGELIKILVVRNDYLTLRRATRMKTIVPVGGEEFKPDYTLVVMEPGRALDFKDVENVVGGHCIPVPFSTAFQRTVDAGLLSSRIPQDIQGALRRIS